MTRMALSACMTEREYEEYASVYRARDELMEALEPFMDDDPCSFDHHGNCQAHLVDNPCSMVKARLALARARGGA